MSAKAVPYQDVLRLVGKARDYAHPARPGGESRSPLECYALLCRSMEGLKQANGHLELGDAISSGVHQLLPPDYSLIVRFGAEVAVIAEASDQRLRELHGGDRETATASAVHASRQRARRLQQYREGTAIPERDLVRVLVLLRNAVTHTGATTSDAEFLRLFSAGVALLDRLVMRLYCGTVGWDLEEAESAVPRHTKKG